MRSKLFVPGARPELFGKALASAADAISIDLEDAVVESRKGEARAAVAEFLRSSESQASSKSIIVRVNALATEHFSADARVIAAPSLALVNLPKVESALEVDAAVATIDRAFVDVRIASDAASAGEHRIAERTAQRRRDRLASARGRVCSWGMRTCSGRSVSSGGIRSTSTR